MNFDIQSYLSNDKKKLPDMESREVAQDTLRKYECFKDIDKELLERQTEICLLDLINSLKVRMDVDRSYILGFKEGLKSLLINLDKYNEAVDILNERI